MANKIKLGNPSAYQKQLSSLLYSVAHRHAIWEVFRDFIAMCAIAISNTVDKINFEEREAEYMRIVGRYTKEEAIKMAEGFDLIVDALEAGGYQDFLGSLYMGMELGNAWKGQFFTPYDMCLLMSQITLGDNVQQHIQKKGFVTVSDPCIGGGAMVIAAAHGLHIDGIAYQDCMHATGADIDIVAVHMSYIQLALFHIPAVICHGNTLSAQVWSEWRTPAHVIGGWEGKLNAAQRADQFLKLLRLLDSEPIPAGESIPAVEVPFATHPLPSLEAINLREQMSLF